MKDTTRFAWCKHADRLGGCDGVQYVAKRYFINGKNLVVCEAHAKAAMAVNPFGPRYIPRRVKS